MKKISQRGMAYLCVILLLALALVFSAVSRRIGVQASEDPLSQGIAARWGAALPDGFTKECAGGIAQTGGRSFARLVYRRDVARWLTKWTAPDADLIARFDALLDAQLDGADAREAELLRAARGVLDDSWLCFSMQDEAQPENCILLAYRPQDRVMLIAEQRAETPNSAGS